MAWEVKYRKEFQRMGITKTYRIDILADAAAGFVTPDKMGAIPLQLKTLGTERDEDKIVIGSELTFEFVLLRRAGEANYDALFQSEYMEHVVKFYSLNPLTLLWQGFLQPENMYKSMFERNLHIYLSATDGLKDLSEFDFLNAGSIITGHQTGLQILKYCLANLNVGSQFEYDFIVKLGTKHDGEGANDTALKDVTHDTRHFVEVKDGRTEVDDCLSVMEKTLRPYSCTIQQWGGKYYILSKHEAATNYYTYNWALVFQSKAASSDLINIDAYKFQREADISYISPVKEVGLRLLNKNIGDQLVADINDYEDATGPWTYANYLGPYDDTGAAMELTAMASLVPPYDNGYVTLASNVNIQKLIASDYLKIKFLYRTTTVPVTPVWPQFQIIAVKDGGTYPATEVEINSIDFSQYESELSATFELVGAVGDTKAYNFQVKIISNDTDEAYVIELRDFEFTRYSSGEEGVTFDSFYKATIAKGKIKFGPVDFNFGDAETPGDFAGLIYAAALTEEWDRVEEAGDDAAGLLWIWAKNFLISRQDYTEYIVCVIKDSGDNITPVNYIQFNSKLYHIVSYDKSFRSSWIGLHLKEWKTANIAITWEYIPLTSVNGQSTANY